MVCIAVQGHGLGQLSHNKRLNRRKGLRNSVKAMNQIREASSLSEPPNSANNSVLYVHVLCPYAQRAWLAFLEKGADFETVNLDLSSKPSWYLRLNRVGQVPAVAYKNNVITESLDICRWADRTFEGADLGQSRTEVQQLVSRSNLASAGLTYLAGRTGRSWGIGSGQTDGQRAQFEQEVSSLEESIEQSGGPYLCGATPTLADIAHYPFAERFDVAMPIFCRYDVRKSGHKLYVQWLDAMRGRKAVEQSSANSDLLLKAFHILGALR